MKMVMKYGWEHKILTGAGLGLASLYGAGLGLASLLYAGTANAQETQQSSEAQQESAGNPAAGATSPVQTPDQPEIRGIRVDLCPADTPAGTRKATEPAGSGTGGEVRMVDPAPFICAAQPYVALADKDEDGKVTVREVVNHFYSSNENSYELAWKDAYNNHGVNLTQLLERGRDAVLCEVTPEERAAATVAVKTAAGRKETGKRKGSLNERVGQLEGKVGKLSGEEQDLRAKYFAFAASAEDSLQSLKNSSEALWRTTSDIRERQERLSSELDAVVNDPDFRDFRERVLKQVYAPVRRKQEIAENRCSISIAAYHEVSNLIEREQERIRQTIGGARAISDDDNKTPALRSTEIDSLYHDFVQQRKEFNQKLEYAQQKHQECTTSTAAAERALQDLRRRMIEVLSGTPYGFSLDAEAGHLMALGSDTTHSAVAAVSAGYEFGPVRVRVGGEVIGGQERVQSSFNEIPTQSDPAEGYQSRGTVNEQVTRSRQYTKGAFLAVEVQSNRDAAKPSVAWGLRLAQRWGWEDVRNSWESEDQLYDAAGNAVGEPHHASGGGFVGRDGIRSTTLGVDLTLRYPLGSTRGVQHALQGRISPEYDTLEERANLRTTAGYELRF